MSSAMIDALGVSSAGVDMLSTTSTRRVIERIVDPLHDVQPPPLHALHAVDAVQQNATGVCRGVLGSAASDWQDVKMLGKSLARIPEHSRSRLEGRCSIQLSYGRINGMLRTE